MEYKNRGNSKLKRNHRISLPSFPLSTSTLALSVVLALSPLPRFLLENANRTVRHQDDADENAKRKWATYKHDNNDGEAEDLHLVSNTSLCCDPGRRRLVLRTRREPDPIMRTPRAKSAENPLFHFQSPLFHILSPYFRIIGSSVTFM